MDNNMDDGGYSCDGKPGEEVIKREGKVTTKQEFKNSLQKFPNISFSDSQLWAA